MKLKKRISNPLRQDQDLTRPFTDMSFSNSKNYIWLILLILASVLTFGFLYSGATKQDLIRAKRDTARRISSPILSQKRHLLDGCYHVYLDVGTNIGIQIRKLFEPSLYKNAKIHQVFNKYFNRNVNNLTSSLPYICAVGFEPNPNHENTLKELNGAYDKCNWRVIILTKTAVSDQDGTSEFFSDHDFKNLEWGGTIIDPSKKLYGQVNAEQTSNDEIKPITLLRLSKFINEIVGTRTIPDYFNQNELGKPSVIMKLDIEGSEVEVVEDLIMQGSLQHLDVMMVEFHTWMAKDKERKKASKILQEIITKIGILSDILTTERDNKHGLKVLPLDDESFYLSNLPLPVC